MPYQEPDPATNYAELAERTAERAADFQAAGWARPAAERPPPAPGARFRNRHTGAPVIVYRASATVVHFADQLRRRMDFCGVPAFYQNHEAQAPSPRP